MTPGLIYDMDDETYHADPVPGGSLSSTFARLLTQHVPAKALARRQNRKPTKAMNFGKAVHAHALGAGPDLIVWEFDGRTKDGKAEREEAKPRIDSEAAVAVTADQRDQLLGMAEVLHNELVVRDLLDGSKHEVSGFWQEGDIWCRARYDVLSDTEPYDYKTAQDVTRQGFSKSMGVFGYHQQADFYERGLRAIGHAAGKSPMRFICQETEPPYLIQIHQPDEIARIAAADLNDRAIGIFAEAQRTGVWPGFPSLIAEPTPLPSWYFFANEEVLPDIYGSAELEIA